MKMIGLGTGRGRERCENQGVVGWLREGCRGQPWRIVAMVGTVEEADRLNDAVVEALAASVHEFGFRLPIVVDEQDIIVVGHSRYKAELRNSGSIFPRSRSAGPLRDNPCH